MPSAIHSHPPEPRPLLAAAPATSPSRHTALARQIESYVFDVVRSSVPKIELDDVFETKAHALIALRKRSRA